MITNQADYPIHPVQSSHKLDIKVFLECINPNR